MALSVGWAPGWRRAVALEMVGAILLCLSATAPARSEEAQPRVGTDFAYGELEVVEEAGEVKSGHISFGPLDPVFDAYFDLKQQARERIGLSWIIEDGLILQGSPMEGGHTTANNELNLIGTWQLFHSETYGTGSIWGWYQFSDTVGSVSTSKFDRELGMITPVNGGDTGTRNQSDRLQFLAWEQKLWSDRVRIMVGQLTTRVFLDLNRYAVSDREDFFTPMIVNNPVALYTARLGLGLFGQYKDEDWYLSFMLRDASADSRGIDFESLGDGELEYAGEFALTPRIPRAGLGFYRLTVHYSDSTRNTRSDVDFALSFDQDVGEHFSPFFRYAWSRKGLRAFKQRTVLGFQIRKPFGFEFDRFGFAAWWGDATAEGAGDETGIELFYMLQIKRWLELSPDLQINWNPGLGTRSAPVVVFGLRLRTVF